MKHIVFIFFLAFLMSAQINKCAGLYDNFFFDNDDPPDTQAIEVDQGNNGHSEDYNDPPDTEAVTVDETNNDEYNDDHFDIKTVSVDRSDVENEDNLMEDLNDLEDPELTDEERERIAAEEEKNHVVIDGDILVTKEQAAIYYKSGWDGLVNSAAWGNTCRWKKRIPVVIHKSISGRVRRNLIWSIKAIRKKTCVKFHWKRRRDRSYLYIRQGSSCSTHLGRPCNGGRRTINLNSSCAGKGRRATPAHEIMHTMGRYHEQTRPDRDCFINVIKGNIRSSCQSQYKKQTKARTLGIGYDYYSSMHYSRWQCAKSRRKPTMSFPKNINPNSVGQRSRLSNKDIQHIKVIHCQNMMMRFVGGQGSFEGRVEVHNNNVWGSVCSDSFDMKDANVMCKYMGFPGVKQIFKTSERFGEGVGPIWMSNLHCTGEEYGPFHCIQNEMGNHDCNHGQDVGVTCKKNARLVNGPNEQSGYLEIYEDGKWGYVCNEQFDLKDAKVACRMMGYSKALHVLSNESYSLKSGPMLMSQLQCDGTEDQLSHCDYDDAYGCTLDKAVALQCGN